MSIKSWLFKEEPSSQQPQQHQEISSPRTGRISSAEPTLPSDSPEIPDSEAIFTKVLQSAPLLSSWHAGFNALSTIIADPQTRAVAAAATLGTGADKAGLLASLTVAKQSLDSITLEVGATLTQTAEMTKTAAEHDLSNVIDQLQDLQSHIVSLQSQLDAAKASEMELVQAKLSAERTCEDVVKTNAQQMQLFQANNLSLMKRLDVFGAVFNLFPK